MSNEHEGFVSPRVLDVCGWLGIVLAGALLVLAVVFLTGCRTQTCVSQHALFAITVVEARDYGAEKRVDPATDLSLPLPTP
jgi:hypothetical protein